MVKEKRRPESTLWDYNPDSSMPGLECGKGNGGFTGFE
jgi:hypothetical protein